ncbi:MAG: hypothetical protein DME60_02225 [Verrucomicrobia bacterium]|nr:MAG: hypothetical protein DME60_02225 [Verrucomicrobiota bacterium]
MDSARVDLRLDSCGETNYSVFRRLGRRKKSRDRSIVILSVAKRSRKLALSEAKPSRTGTPWRYHKVLQPDSWTHSTSLSARLSLGMTRY